MDLFGAVSSAVFTTGQSRGLNVDDMASASGLASAEIMTHYIRHPGDAMLYLFRIVFGTENDRTLHMRLALGTPMCVYAGSVEGTQIEGAIDDAGGLGSQSSLRFFGPNTKQTLLLHSGIVFHSEIQTIKHCVISRLQLFQGPGTVQSGTFPKKHPHRHSKQVSDEVR